MYKYKIAVLPGDGIGPEITEEVIRVLEKISFIYKFSFEFKKGLIGGSAIDIVGIPLPKDTIDLCLNSDAIILGAVGGEKWDNLPVKKRPEVGALLPLRKLLKLYGNIRPIFVYDDLSNASKLKKDIIYKTDFLIIRELTSGIYFGKKYRGIDKKGIFAVDENKYYESEIIKVARLGFDLARTRKKKLTSIDKANVLETSRLWRETIIKLHKNEYMDIELEHLYVDNAAMQIILRPKSFDVLLTENMFGDILTDQASVLNGSIGMLASASVGGKIALYEPAHGSAPNIAGQGKANPIAAILSGAMMLKYSFNLINASVNIENAIKKVLKIGYRTEDIMENNKKIVKTKEITNLIIDNIEENF